MVYQDKFVVSVKVNGNVLREHNRDHVYLPFGSEYSILLKNLESRKALVTIRIDGKNVLGIGQSLVLDPKQTVDLQRFLVDNNMETGPKFKFIEKTQQISEHRGDKAEDGIIEIEYQFEIEKDYGYLRSIQWVPKCNDFNGSGSYGQQMYSSCDLTTKGISPRSTYSNQTESSIGPDSLDPPQNDEGITVPGSNCNQIFKKGHIGELEITKRTICLKLHGGIAPNITVKEPLTVKTKITCKTCGTKNKSNHKFCSNCGTNLEW